MMAKAAGCALWCFIEMSVAARCLSRARKGESWPRGMQCANRPAPAAIAARDEQRAADTRSGRPLGLRCHVGGRVETAESKGGRSCKEGAVRRHGERVRYSVA